MKVTIEFCPVEDKFALEAAIKATDMWSALKNTMQHLSKTIEKMENSEEYSELAIKEIELLKETLSGELTDNGLDNLIFNY